jgi:hypothetical protein
VVRMMNWKTLMQDRRSPSRRVIRHNETLSLELQGACEFPSSSCASGSPKVKGQDGGLEGMNSPF